MAQIYNDSVQKIDTSLFDSTIAAFKSAIDQYREARERIFKATEDLLNNWDGEGSDRFASEYKLLKTKLSDEEDNLRTIADDLLNMKQSYVDWDTDTAKVIGGNN